MICILARISPLNSRPRVFALGVVACCTWGDAALAGMPRITLGDIRRVLAPSDMSLERLEVISFFLLGFLVLAGVVRVIWNVLRQDFQVLPRLTYPKAVGLLVLWGLLFILVLTMISGARELMTPGAWKPDGLTSKLVRPEPTTIERQISERYEAIGRLRDALWRYAEGHDGRYPDQTAAIPEPLWLMPGSDGDHYVYRGGRLPDEDDFGTGGVLAYEPDAVGPDRLVILEDGEVAWMPMVEIERSLGEAHP